MFRLMLVVLLALLAVAGLTAVSAQEATPTPTSTITIRFVRDGQPVTVLLAAPLRRLTAEGVPCPIAITPAGVKSSGFSVDWPLLPAGGEPLECSKGPPTTLRFEFLTVTVSGVLSAEFVWTGSAVIFDIEVPSEIPIITPTPTPPPPEELPPTGTAPEKGGSRFAWTLSPSWRAV